MKPTIEQNKVIGLPQGMPYHQYGHLWKSFFLELGINIITSKPTTADTLKTGIIYAPTDSCLAMKIYLGHVASLIGKCDFILVPKLSNYGKDREFCPYFEELYDIVLNIFHSSEQKFLVYQIDALHGLTEQTAFVSLGKTLGFSAHESKKAYLAAIKENFQIQKQLVLTENSKFKLDGLKIFIAAHSYMLEDAYIATPIRKFLHARGVQVISGYIADKDAALKNSTMFFPSCRWEMSREILGNLAQIQSSLDGIILITFSPCNPDTVVNSFLMREMNAIPVLNLVVDSQSKLVDFEPELENFIELARLKKRKLKN